MKIKLSTKELHARVIEEIAEYPKYVTSILNLANRFSQGTRPKVVGQLSELVRECPARDYDGWRDWYLERHPEAIMEATARIMGMVERFREATAEIDEPMVRNWVQELVMEKTFAGLRVEKAILEKASEKLVLPLRNSSPEEESRGIDGYLGDAPISVKPQSYKTMDTIGERISARMIYYEKVADGSIVADLSAVIEG